MSRDTMTCPQCGARNRTRDRRCRVCTTVINGHLSEPLRGLAALRPDHGHGATFTARWELVSKDPEPVTAEACGSGHGEAPLPAPGVGWLSWAPNPPTPVWEPETSTVDDPSLAVARAIEVDAPARNGWTPPPIEHDEPPFDPSLLVVERVV